MEGKNKTALFALSALAATAVGIFCVANTARAADSDCAGLTITEIMYDPDGNNSDHAKWVELINLSDQKITLNFTGNETSSGRKIKDLKITDSFNHYLYAPGNTPIEIDSGDFLIITNNLANFAKDYPDLNNSPIAKSAITLTNSSDLYNLTLFDNNFVLDTIAYSKSWGASNNGKSLEKIDLSDNNGEENWRESCDPGGSPGEKTSSEPCPIEKDDAIEQSSTSQNFQSAEKVYLNEILANPKGGSEDEYIEIRNGGSEPVDLFGWTIKDASRGKGHKFGEHTLIKSSGYFVIYRPQLKLALNNSGESVFLYDPDENLISSVSYDKSIKNASYNFDGDEWRWSKYLTPGEENKFDSEPSVKIKKPKHAYKNFYTEFSVKAKDKETKKLKYVWDFGDGKKSYLEDPTHKYLDTGKYEVALSVTDDSQTIEKNFTVNVKKYPLPDLEIVKLVPNPAGNDSLDETVDLKNGSNKEVNLDGWKIATGSDNTLTNHPIAKGITLAAGEIKTITREMSKFTLNNKSGKVQLISPDGKIADEVGYSKEKIAEGEAYAKINGEWQWLAPGENTVSTVEQPAVLGAMDIMSPRYNSRFTSEDAYIFLSRINFLHKPKELNYSPMFNSSSTIAYLIASTI